MLAAKGRTTFASKLLVAVFTVAAIGSLLFSDAANAAVWQSFRTGYFTGVADNSCYDQGQADECFVLSGGVPDSISDVQSFYDYIKGQYDGGNTRNRTGASFVVNTMLGHSQPRGTTTLSAADWSDWLDRMNALTRINWSLGNAECAQYDTGMNASIDVYRVPYGACGTYIDFYNGGTLVYRLNRKCANPDGQLPGLPVAQKWTISVSTSLTHTSSATTPPLGTGAIPEVIPGNTVTWNHTIKNTGPDSTTKDVAWHYVNSNGWGGTGGDSVFAAGKANGATAPLKYSYTIQSSDLGKTLCQNVSAQPQAWNDASAIQSTPACVTVVYRYELTPNVSVGNGTIQAGAGGGSVTYSVGNTGPTDSPPTTQWVLTSCQYGPTQTPPSGPNLSKVTTDTQTPQSYYGGGCGNSGGSTSFPRNATTEPQQPDPISVNTTNALAGTHFCYGLSVHPPGTSESGSDWIHSPLVCIAIVKFPKVQALGGDVLSGTVSTTQPYNLGGQFYGSWAQYGIFGMGSVSGMASGGSLAGGGSSNSGSILNSLTFANTPSLGNFYSSNPSTTAYYNTYNALCTPGATPVSGAIPNGTSKVICVNGDLTIASDITYSGQYNSPSDVPRIIYVVSGNIIVNDNVQQIDAWLIGKKTLYTCNKYMSRTTQLTTNDCNKPLTFNGPVYVHDTLLGRTYGADGGADKGTPAEVFNLAPSNFLSNYSASVSASNIQTEYEKELPPRW